MHTDQMPGIQGNYAKAEPLYERSLAIKEKVLGLEHPHVAISLNNLAMLFHDQVILLYRLVQAYHPICFERQKSCRFFCYLEI